VDKWRRWTVLYAAYPQLNDDGFVREHLTNGCDETSKGPGRRGTSVPGGWGTRPE